MIRTMLSKVAKRFIRDNELGQSVVILALGMVGLLVVVGITVDISILFVRFSTLRRAVDSASIAAAGQMRQDRSIAEVGLAARQFIEFHNLNPRDVLVETCHTSQVLDASGTSVVSEDPELCTEDQRKLVRVTAEIDSPTVFLRLVGFDNIVLRTSAISETATLDVVVVMDVSESMLNETTPVDWADVNQGIAYVPPRAYMFDNYYLSGNADVTQDPTTVIGRYFIDATEPGGYDIGNGYVDEIGRFWQGELLGATQAEVNSRVFYTGTAPDQLTNIATANPYYEAQYFVPDVIPNPGQQYHPRAACRVRFFPYSTALSPPEDLLALYDDNGFSYHYTATQQNWALFVPTYNFYGCCNDPGDGDQIYDADGNPTHEIDPGTNRNPPMISNGASSIAADFSDLVCQPFRTARDATREFIQRIDFVRGDRLAFVTFDRTAFIIDPDGTNGPGSHMLEDRRLAYDTLDRMVGVRAEPNYYDWWEEGGGWIGFSRGLDRDSQSMPIDYDLTTVDALEYNDYPVAGNCPYYNATLNYPFSRYATRGAGVDPNSFIFSNPNRVSWFGSPALYNIMTPDVAFDPLWNAASGYDSRPLTPFNSYELWGSCRGTNIGSALREANNALVDPATTRINGSVWVIVMLSDGAAGASDPARRFGVQTEPAFPYEEVSNDPAGLISYGTRGEYGAYGVCPYGSADNVPYSYGELVDTIRDNAPADERERTIEFPYCSDESATTRHICDALNQFDVGFQPGSEDPSGNGYDLDVADFPNFPVGREQACLYYDVDDYARDWADYVGGIEHNDASDNSAGDLNLPTMFTIGFGLNFEDGDGSCDDNIEDCLGEELLRYIADVGDNFNVDTDYQQDYIDDGQLNDSITTDLDPLTDYGQPDPCEPQDGTGYIVNPDGTYEINLRDSGTSCGNYYNAPGPEELESVFDEIASRMFTRLSQ